MTSSVPVALPTAWATAWRAHPDRAVLEVLGEGSLTARELDHRSMNAASALGSLGVSPGARVVWEAVSSLDAIIVALGVLRCGAVLVPVADRQSDIERQTVIDDVDPTVVVAERRATVGTVTEPPRELLARRGPAVELDGAAADDVALIVYTSGTTGRPKGAVHTHGSIAAQAASLTSAWGWTAADRLLIALPLFHVHGLVVGLFTGLSTGGAVTCQPVFDTGAFLDAIDQAAATMAFCVPTMLYRIDAHPNADLMASLRLVVSGSAPLSPRTFEAFERRGISILERYGMTETLLTISNPLEGERRPGTVGRALPGVSLKLPPAGEDGELLVSGPTLFAGYWRRPDATAEIMTDGWVSTGDIVRVDGDGYVIICGRSKELIISGGFNVYPSEVEDVLRAIDGVDDAAVVGAPSDEWGEVVVAYLVTPAGMDVDSIAEKCAEALSPYKRPRRFTEVEEIPRNSLGKVQRHLL